MSLRFRFTTGSLLWLTAIAAILLAWGADHVRLVRANARIAAEKDRQVLMAARQHALQFEAALERQHELTELIRAAEAE
jgi:hypothetical protein